MNPRPSANVAQNRRPKQTLNVQLRKLSRAGVQRPIQHEIHRERESSRSRGRATQNGAAGSCPLTYYSYFAVGEATSFWKRGSFRNGSNIGSSRSSAGVSTAFAAIPPSYGIDSSCCKAAIARSDSRSCAATRARFSSIPGPVHAMRKRRFECWRDLQAQLRFFFLRHRQHFSGLPETI
jgi:hypothetical protein